MKISIILEKLSKTKYIGFIFWIIVWQALSVEINQEILLVSPFSAIKRLSELIFEQQFWIAITNSSFRIILGFLLSLITGVVLAMFSANYRIVEAIIKPMMDMIKSVPVVSFIILCLIWVSTKYLSTLISFLMVLPVIYDNCHTGIKSIPKEMIEMVSIFKVDKLRQVRYLYVSEVMKYLKAGCSISLGLCWKSGVAAEVIGIPKGTIGENLYNAKIYLSSADLFAWTMTIVVISILFRRLFMYMLEVVENRLK